METYWKKNHVNKSLKKITKQVKKIKQEISSVINFTTVPIVVEAIGLYTQSLDSYLDSIQTNKNNKWNFSDFQYINNHYHNVNKVFITDVKRLLELDCKIKYEVQGSQSPYNYLVDLHNKTFWKK